MAKLDLRQIKPGKTAVQFGLGLPRLRIEDVHALAFGRDLGLFFHDLRRDTLCVGNRRLKLLVRGPAVFLKRDLPPVLGRKTFAVGL